MLKYKYTQILFLVTLISSLSYCQIITDIAFKKDSSFVLINYRIKECPSKKYYNIQLASSTKKGVYSPKFLMGDFQQVDCFGLKTIVWNNNFDSISFSLDDRIRIELIEVEKLPLLFNLNLNYNSLVDVDNNSYKTIEIGKQTWMAENLRVKHFKNGDKLEVFSEDKVWSELTEPTWTNYNSDETFDKSYGKIYNWLVVHDKRGVCPKGWRVPKIGDWQLLLNYIGKHTSGGLIKEVGYSKWKMPNLEASNFHGFTGVPSGYIDVDTKFKKLGEQSTWWSSSVYFNDYISTANLYFSENKFDIGTMSNSSGLPIRCIKE